MVARRVARDDFAAQAMAALALFAAAHPPFVADDFGGFLPLLRAGDARGDGADGPRDARRGGGGAAASAGAAQPLRRGDATVELTQR
jgi:hypothetical protein